MLWDDNPKARQVWFAGDAHRRGRWLPRAPAIGYTARLDNPDGGGARPSTSTPTHDVSIVESADGLMHDSQDGWWKKLYRDQVRFWPPGRTDKPVVHRSVVDRAMNQDNKHDPRYRPWILDLDYETENWVHYENQQWRWHPESPGEEGRP